MQLSGILGIKVPVTREVIVRMQEHDTGGIRRVRFLVVPDSVTFGTEVDVVIGQDFIAKLNLLGILNKNLIAYENRREKHLAWKQRELRPPYNRQQVLQRARKLYYQHAEHRDCIKAELAKYEREGWIRRLPPGEFSRHYAPLHVVYKDSLTTPLRIVYDAASSGLNDYLKGKNWSCEDVRSFLLKWRCAKYWAIGDLQKAFLKIRLTPTDRLYCGILWYEEEPGQTIEYQWNVLPFGLACSPYILQKQLGKMLGDSTSGYMDDILIVAKTKELLEEEVQGTVDKLASINQKFHDTEKWICSANRDQASILGCLWSGNEQDEVRPKMTIKEEELTVMYDKGITRRDVTKL